MNQWRSLQMPNSRNRIMRQWWRSSESRTLSMEKLFEGIRG